MTSTWTAERPRVPAFDVDDAQRLAWDVFGLDATARELPSYIDRNFRLELPDGTAFVLRIANGSEQAAHLQLENLAMERVAALGLGPEVRRSRNGRTVERTRDADGHEHAVRLMTFFPGTLLRDRFEVDAETAHGLGRMLASVDRALVDLADPGRARHNRWDLGRARWIVGALPDRVPAGRRALVERVQLQFLADVERLSDVLPRSWIHGDANPGNLTVREGDGPARVSGLFDFGDMTYSARVFEVAVTGAYLLVDQADPLRLLTELVRGYQECQPLTDDEVGAVFPSVCMRLAVSVTVSTLDSAAAPDNDYVLRDQAPSWELLERLAAISPAEALAALRGAPRERSLDRATVVELRARHMGPSLSLSYREPLEIVRGRMQYLFDREGRAYLDGVNNVCHVGHCHPRVVAAAQGQIATLNTNTRYLHDHVARYAERLTSMFPEPLSVAYFVNSGSEANELALRLARAATGRRDMLVVASGYHGNTSALVDLSDYKHSGPGGRGAPDWVHVVPCPDVPGGGPEDGVEQAQHVSAAIESARSEGREMAGFLVEPLIGCGGQIVPPPGYLREAFAHVRAAGGLCIADEVQVGFGRVGTHWWAHQRDGVVPDIVTLGKPMGNGHPMAAVITTPAIAAAFDVGMEYFSTYGGNPVSAAIGLAVLDVLEQDGLRDAATRVGDRLLQGFRSLAQRHEVIGDVRGVGLYLGVEFVHDRATREPAADVLADVIESARCSGVLLSADGPRHNVLKIKPPMCLTETDADLLLAVVGRGALRVAADRR